MFASRVQRDLTFRPLANSHYAALDLDSVLAGMPFLLRLFHSSFLDTCVGEYTLERKIGC